jgi:hypothetical protein
MGSGLLLAGGFPGFGDRWRGSMVFALVCVLLCVGLPVLTAWIVLAINVLSISHDRRR